MTQRDDIDAALERQHAPLPRSHLQPFRTFRRLRIIVVAASAAGVVFINANAENNLRVYFH
jgi:hypothetical protein